MKKIRGRTGASSFSRCYRQKDNILKNDVDSNERQVEEQLEDDISSLEKLLFQEANWAEVDCMEDVMKMFCV